MLIECFKSYIHTIELSSQILKYLFKFILFDFIVFTIIITYEIA